MTFIRLHACSGVYVWRGDEGEVAGYTGCVFKIGTERPRAMQHRAIQFGISESGEANIRGCEMRLAKVGLVAFYVAKVCSIKTREICRRSYKVSVDKSAFAHLRTQQTCPGQRGAIKLCACGIHAIQIRANEVGLDKVRADQRGAD